MTTEPAAQPTHERVRQPRTESPREVLREYLRNHTTSAELRQVLGDLASTPHLVGEIRWQASHNDVVEEVLGLCVRLGYMGRLLEHVAKLPGPSPELVARLLKVAWQYDPPGSLTPEMAHPEPINLPPIESEWFPPRCAVTLVAGSTTEVNDPFAWLNTYFANPRLDEIPRTLSILGLIGAGRTHLCIRFAWTNRHSYHYVARIRCAAGLTSARADIIAALSAAGSNCDDPGLDRRDLKTLLWHLADSTSRSGRRSLLIFDDLDPMTPKDDATSAESLIASLVPSTGPFDILLIRSSQRVRTLPTLQLLRLSPSHAVGLLLYGELPSFGWSARQRQIAERVVAALHYCPAPIAIASKLLVAEGTDVDEWMAALASLNPNEPPRFVVEAYTKDWDRFLPPLRDDDGFAVLCALIGKILSSLSDAETHVLLALAWFAPDQPVDRDLLTAVIKVMPRAGGASAASPLDVSAVARASTRLARCGLIHEVNGGRPAISAVVQAVILVRLAQEGGIELLRKQELAVLTLFATRPCPEIDEDWQNSRLLERRRGEGDATIVHLRHSVERALTGPGADAVQLERPHFELVCRLIRYLRWEESILALENLAAAMLKGSPPNDIRRRVLFERGIAHSTIDGMTASALADLLEASSDPRPDAGDDLVQWIHAKAIAIKLQAEVGSRLTGVSDPQARAVALKGDAAQIDALIGQLPAENGAWRVRASLHRKRAELLGAAAAHSDDPAPLLLDAERALAEALVCFDVLSDARKAVESDWHLTRYLLARSRLEHTSDDSDIDAHVQTLREAYEGQAECLAPVHNTLIIMRTTLIKWLAVAGYDKEARELAETGLRDAEASGGGGALAIAAALAILGFVDLWAAWRVTASGTQAAREVERLQDARKHLERAMGLLRASGTRRPALLSLWRFDEQFAAALLYIADYQRLTPSHLPHLEQALQSVRESWPPRSEQLIRRERALKQLEKLC